MRRARGRRRSHVGPSPTMITTERTKRAWRSWQNASLTQRRQRRRRRRRRWTSRKPKRKRVSFQVSKYKPHCVHVSPSFCKVPKTVNRWYSVLQQLWKRHERLIWNFFTHALESLEGVLDRLCLSKRVSLLQAETVTVSEVCWYLARLNFIYVCSIIPLHPVWNLHEPVIW